jgi:signal transduction histidine kinase
MRSLVDFRGGSVCLVEDSEIRVAAADPEVSAEVAAARLPVGSGLVGDCVRTGAAVYSPDLDEDPRVDPELRRLGSNAGMRSYLAVPLICLGDVIGCMQVDATTVDAFDDDDLRVLEGLAAQVAGLIESARRYEQMFALERLKSDFISRASHELRTPLTISSGFVTTLVDQFERFDDAQRRLFLDKIKGANDRLWYLVDELLSVTMLEAGAAQPRPQAVQVAAVCEEVRQLSQHPEAVTVTCAAGVVVEADPLIVRQLTRLLVDNALKYAGSAEVTVIVPEDADGWILEVRDRGPGIPPELRPHLFERFSRGEHESAGLGLGLFLARSAIRGW